MSRYGIPWLDRFRGTPLEARALELFEQRQSIEQRAYELEDVLSMPNESGDVDPSKAKADKEQARINANQELAEMQAKLTAASQALEDDFVAFRTEQAYAPDWQAMSKGVDELGEYMLDAELSKALDAGDLDGALDWLEKGAGHKYIKRIPTGKVKPKYTYVYNVTSKHMGRSPKVGEKVAVAHGEQKGHYEVTGHHDDDHVTMRHDETGHEMKVHKDHVHEMVAQEHEGAVDAAHKRLARTHEAAARHGTEAQQKRAKAALDAHREKYGYDASAKRAGQEHMETAKRDAAKIYDEGQRAREAAAAKEKPPAEPKEEPKGGETLDAQIARLEEKETALFDQARKEGDPAKSAALKKEAVAAQQARMELNKRKSGRDKGTEAADEFKARDNEAAEHAQGLGKYQAGVALDNLRVAQLGGADALALEAALVYGRNDLNAFVAYYTDKQKKDPEGKHWVELTWRYMQAQRLQSDRLSPGSALHRKALAYHKRAGNGVWPDGFDNDDTPYVLRDARKVLAKQGAKEPPPKAKEATAAEPPKAAEREQWGPSEHANDNRHKLDGLPEGTQISYLDESGYHEYTYQKKGKVWHELLEYGTGKLAERGVQSRELGKELAEEAEWRPGTYVDGKKVVQADVTITPPGYHEAMSPPPSKAKPEPKAEPKPPPVAERTVKGEPQPEVKAFGPSRNELKEALTGTTYKWEQYGRLREIEKVGSGKWVVRGGDNEYTTTDSGAHSTVPHKPDSMTKHRFGEAAAKKAGKSLAQHVADVQAKHNATIDKAVRKGDKGTLGQFDSRWQDNTMRLEHEGATYYSNGHAVISDKHLTPGQKKKLDAHAKKYGRDLTPGMLEKVRPERTDVAYHYVGPHPEFVGDRANAMAVYASEDGEHVALVNAHYAPPATLHGTGNEADKLQGGLGLTRSPLVGDPSKPEHYLIMPAGQSGSKPLKDLQEVARKLGGAKMKKSLSGLGALAQYLNGDDAEAMEKAQMYAKQERLFQKADDGKPGESLGETSTEELQATAKKLKGQVGDNPALQARYKAIMGELQKRTNGGEGMSKGLHRLGDYLRKSGIAMPVKDPDGMPKHGEAKLGHPKSSSIGNGSADGGELDGVGKTGGSGDSAPAPGTGKDGMPTGASSGKTKFSEDDEQPEGQMKDHKKPLEQSVARKSLSPASQREDMAYEHAKRVGELTKSDPDVTVGGAPHPLSHTAVHGDTDAKAEALLKSEFYYGPPPTLAPKSSVLRSSVLCKSDACGQPYGAMLTACPHCGTDTVQSRMLPKGGYVGGRGDSAVILTKSNEPLLRPAPQEPDIYLPGKE